MKGKIILIISAASVLGLVVAFSFLLARNTEQVEVNYVINNKIVKTKKVVRGNKLNYTYTYESNDHQSYAYTWVDLDGNVVDEKTIINKSIPVYGTPLESVIYSTNEEDEYTSIDGFNHYYSDGKVVIASSYLDKEVVLGNNVISNNDKIKEIYLPGSLHLIGEGNFVNCSKLETIYFAGNEEAWDDITLNSEIPESVTLLLNTPFEI